MPPRHGKSELISRYFPAWYLGNFPDRRVMLTSYEAQFASGWGRRAREVLEEYGPGVFGVDVRADSSAANRWDLVGHEGGMITAGVGGPITGRGADLLIIDDPIKNREEALSSVYRERHWEWWRSTARTRLQPGGAVVLVMTRWHEDDLAGRLLAEPGDRWREIRLPALAWGPDELGREEGEALWPSQYDAADLAEIAEESGSYWWEAMYQQRPSPSEGGILERGWWRRYPAYGWPQLQHVAQSWDMAFKDTKGTSYVVGQVWGTDLAARYLLCQVRARLSFTKTLGAVEALTGWVGEQGFGSHRILVEEKANGAAVIDSLRRKIGGLIPVMPDGSKEARAHAVSPLIESGNVHIPEGLIPAPAGFEPTPTDVFVEEAAAFPNGANDDQVDAMTQALSRLRSTPQRARMPRAV